MEKSFLVYGKVQGVMFRQTFIRALIKRNLQGGATNNNDHDKTVSITISGSNDEIEKIIDQLVSIKIINSWNATIQEIIPLEKTIEINKHEVTTENVDNIKWSSGVEFYI